MSHPFLVSVISLNFVSPPIIPPFSQFPNLQLRDQTVAPIDLWANAGDDTLEGTFFRMLKESDANPEVVQLAARISRQLLSGQEVAL